MPDVLPDEPGGYTGFDAIFGNKYLAPMLAGAANSGDNRTFANGDSFPVIDAEGNLTDLNGTEIDGEYSDAPGPGFPGYGPITAAQSLSYVADMQETGVPVTYAYISDVHGVAANDAGPCSPASTYKGKPDVGYADGPGDNCYYQTTASVQRGLRRLHQADRGRRAHAAEHALRLRSRRGRPLLRRQRQPGRDSRAAPARPLTTSYICSYAVGQVGEVEASVHGLLEVRGQRHRRPSPTSRRVTRST